MSGWIYQLAGQYSRRVRMTVEDLAHEIKVEVLLHLDTYNPALGKPTTWTTWRARKVVLYLRRKRGRISSATPFSQMDGRVRGEDHQDLAEVLALAGPDADTDRLERAEDKAELRAGVRRAVARLPAAQRERVSKVFGLAGGPPASTCRAVAAAAGVNHQAVNQSVRLGLATLSVMEDVRELAERHGLG